MNGLAPKLPPTSYSKFSGARDTVGFYLFVCLFERAFLCLEAVLELALVDQAGLELTEIQLPLPPECWD